MQLAYLNDVKSYLNISDTNSDTILGSLINSVSNVVMSYLQRPNFVKTTFTEPSSGRGTSSIMLRNWPVLSVTSLSVNDSPVPAAPNCNAYGYSLEIWDGSLPGKPQNLLLNGIVGAGPVSGINGWNQPYGAVPASAGFNRGMNNIVAVYQAGYCVQNEPQTIPATGTYVLNPLIPNGPWSQDDGVSYANGTPLTKVKTLTGAGQYTVSQFSASGVATYTFDSADAAAAVLLNYSYIPFDLSEAVIEIIGERFKYRDRIGQVSKSLGGNETASYSQKVMQDWQKFALNPYRKSFPL